MNQKILHADLKLKKRVARSMSAAALVGVVAAVGVRWYMAQQLVLAQTDVENAVINAMWLIRSFAVIAGAGLLLGSLYWARLALKIGRSGQYPPPRMSVLKDTPIRTGAAAKCYGYTAAAVAMLLLVLGTCGMYGMQAAFGRVIAPPTAKKASAAPAQNLGVRPKLLPDSDV